VRRITVELARGVTTEFVNRDSVFVAEWA
jgi:hypothetical protein